MKLNFLKYFFACLIGLMASNAGQAKASGTVIGGQLYLPLSLKLALTYYDSNGKFKKLAVSTKDILLALGYAKNDQIASGPGGDVYVIDKGLVVADLTAGGFCFAQLNQLLYSETHPNDGEAFSFTESGLLTMKFYSDGSFEDPSGHGSDLWFEVSGTYTGSGQVSAAKNNQQTTSHSIKSSALSGGGFDADVTSANENNPAPLPVTGSVSASGSGKVLVSE